MNPADLATATANLPITVLLMLVLIGGYLEWWVFGTLHRAQVKELESRIKLAEDRAERWEARFLGKHE